MKKTHRRPFWLIVSRRSGGSEVLRTTVAGSEEALPVFSFEDEARMFLELETSGRWQVREMTAAELTSSAASIAGDHLHPPAGVHLAPRVASLPLRRRA